MAADLTTSNPLVQETSSLDFLPIDKKYIDRLINTGNLEQMPTIIYDLPEGTAAVPTNTIRTQVMPASYSLAPTQQVGVTQPIGYKFNLPPHDWSLPLTPKSVDPEFVGTNYTASSHGLRRGRLWYWVGATDSSTSADTSGAQNVIDTSWGFQFLWNPTTISTSVTRNMDITPSSADKLRVVAGVFPGQETVDLQIVIDRTNDFACLYGASEANWKNFTQYYNAMYPAADTSQDMVTQLNNLMAQGTMADLEYLFKAVNGSGNGQLEWTNLLGKKTANVGYLSPTLLGIQLGPTLNNLSYVGWISNLGINHTAFTQGMVPIRTEVSISIQCFSGSGLTSGA